MKIKRRIDLAASAAVEAQRWHAEGHRMSAVFFYFNFDFHFH